MDQKTQYKCCHCREEYATFEDVITHQLKEHSTQILQYAELIDSVYQKRRYLGLIPNQVQSMGKILRVQNDRLIIGTVSLERPAAKII